MRNRTCAIGWCVILAAAWGCDGRAPVPVTAAFPDEAPMLVRCTEYRDPVEPIEGYADRFSYDVGESVHVYYANERGGAHPFLGSYMVHDLLDDRVVRRVQLDSERLPIVRHPCETWHGRGCNYPTGLALDTADLPAGSYYAVLYDFVGRASHRIYFNLRPPAAAVGETPVVLMFPTFTYWAYASFGCGNLYGPALGAGRWEASLRRPLTFDGPPHEAYLVPDSMAPFARGLRDQGIPYVAISSRDLHEHPGYLANARVLILGAHDEYWSWPIAEAIHTFLDRGGRVAVFGYGVQARVVEVLPTAIAIDRSGTAGTPDSPVPWTGAFTAPWIDQPAEERFGLAMAHGGQPLTELSIPQARRAGVLREALEEAGGVAVADAAHPIFGGTGLRTGDVFGSTLDVQWRRTDGLPLTADGEVDYAAVPRAARNIRVLAHAMVNRRRRSAPEIERCAVIAEVRPPTGGIVLHFGSAGWFNSVRTGDSTGVRIFDNTVQYLLTAD